MLKGIFSRAAGVLLARVALGLFILWQLFFLVAQNFLDLARESRDDLPESVQEAVEAVAPGWSQKRGPVHEAVEAVTSWTGRWSRLTAQPQGWELFAPTVAADCAFPVVELRWDEPPMPPWQVPGLLAPLAAGRPLEAALLAAAFPVPTPLMPHQSVMLLSDNEPADLSHFLRLGNFRLRRYETCIGAFLVPQANETAAQQRERWRGEIEYYLRQEADTVRAYLRWRMEAYLQAHPDRPLPRQVLLHVRRYHIRPPEDNAPSPWQGPDNTTQARWRPGLSCPAAFLPVEAFDPGAGSFRWLQRGGPP
jgi:hypothetical protein